MEIVSEYSTNKRALKEMNRHWYFVQICMLLLLKFSTIDDAQDLIEKCVYILHINQFRTFRYLFIFFIYSLYIYNLLYLNKPTFKYPAFSLIDSGKVDYGFTFINVRRLK